MKSFYVKDLLFIKSNTTNNVVTTLVPYLYSSNIFLITFVHNMYELIYSDLKFKLSKSMLL